MFNGQKPQKPKAKIPVPRDSAVTILTSGCHFNGKLYCRGSSRIGGRIEGEIVSEGLLIIEEPAMIKAEITAEETIIQGSVKGKLTAKGRVELAATSRFEGDIATPSLVINEGARFSGRSLMEIEEVREPTRLVDAKASKAATGPDARPGPNASVEPQPEVAVMQVADVRPSPTT